MRCRCPRRRRRHGRTGWAPTTRAATSLARLIYGFRISVLFGLTLTAPPARSSASPPAPCRATSAAGSTSLFQRVIEIWSGLPVLYLLIILASLVEPNFWWLLGLMLLFSWMALVGVVRAEFLRARNFDYVRAARALGVRTAVIMVRHVLPNAMVATLTFLPFILNGSITTLTSLDFLGFGLPPGSPSLGEILAQGKANLQAPWIGITGFLVLAVMLSLLVFIGEAVRDAFDPRKASVTGAAPPRLDVPLLEVRDLPWSSTRRGGPARRARRVLRDRARGDARARRRERLGQVGHRAVDPPAPALPARPAPGGQHPLPGRRDAAARPRRPRGHPRQPHRDGVPGADDLAEPAPHHREAGRRDPRRAQGHDAGGGARAGARAPAPGRARGRPSSASAPIRTSSRAASASA